jgi:chromosome segregation ATPase
MNGFAYLLTQVATLAVGAAILGLLAGRYLWPRRVVEGAPSAPSTTTPPPSDLEPALVNLEERLRASESEVLELRRAVSEVSDQKDVEMGRLESGAIRALDSVITTHQQQLASLRDQLDAATETAREHEERLEAERLLSERLRTVLATRDEHIAELTQQLNGRSSEVPSPAGEN